MGEQALSAEDLENIRQVENVGKTAVTACYTQELERRGDKTLAGSVTVQIYIEPTGIPKVVKITGGTLHEPRVHQCIQKVVEGWEFPKLRAAAWYTTAYAFDPAY